VLGDAKTVLAGMLEHADPSTAERRHRLARDHSRHLPRVVREVRPLLGSDAVPIRPERMCNELTKHVPTTRSSSSTPATRHVDGGM